MDVIKTAIDGVLILEPKVFGDNRGYFFESFSQREFDEKVTPILGHTINFVQDNESMSSYGVMRGLHFQRPPFTQSKLVRCVKGAVLDVAVDIRKSALTYGQHVECLLCAHDEEGERIAKQFAGHTFNCQLSPFNCQLGQQFFVPRGFILDDSLNIDWRIPTAKVLLSEKDTKHSLLKDFDSPFSVDDDLYEK